MSSMTFAARCAMRRPHNDAHRCVLQIRELHSRCYPGEQDPGDSLEDAFEQICFLHDPANCTWFLLWLPDGSGAAAAGNGGSRCNLLTRNLLWTRLNEPESTLGKAAQRARCAVHVFTRFGSFICIMSHRRLAGMCAGVQYHDSFYVFAFGVDPAFRRQVHSLISRPLHVCGSFSPLYLNLHCHTDGGLIY